ncbi:tail fiber protein [Sphingomonas sp.]|uniref:phage tail protein n=1 Tax=Sphingomonas sp. TaxID=28214 RepID=UPI001B09AD9D|nr:tail fiber protein [Sphingomonas sp.]MBO9715032.1 phage tail protein [Sphingomonas sp.]
MTGYYLGEIRPFAGNFAPRNWATCSGQLLSIAQNNALFALLGTTYGGDGITTFGLPDLRGRVALSQGQGPGLTNRVLGEKSGTETVTLITQQIPQHNHAILATTAGGTAANPSGLMPGTPDQNGIFYLNSNVASPADAPLPADTITNTGGNQPHDNIMPILAITYIIALQGIFPSQN